jgi:dolichol-phosphate mannosyltransferase
MSVNISIIIPFLNEYDNIPHLAQSLNEFTSKHNQLTFEVILVNDGSTDDSVSLIKKTKFPDHTKLVSLSQNYGSHAALRAGIFNSTGQFVSFMYADLQDPLSLVIEMYQKAQEGFDIVWATRNEVQNKWSERVFSQQYAKLMQRYVNKKYPDRGFDIVMFNQKSREELNKNIESNSSIFLQILNFGFKQSFIFYNKQARAAGKSKWTFQKKVKLLIDSFIAFSYAPIRFVSIMGMLFFMLGAIWTFYIIGRKIMLNDLQSGWPALTSILLLGFGITNISLGIVAEYLWRTLDSSRKRPVFIVDEIITL